MVKKQKSKSTIIVGVIGSVIHNGNVIVIRTISGEQGQGTSLGSSVSKNEQGVEISRICR